MSHDHTKAQEPATQTPARLLLLLFFLSGATGLMYEIVWVRRFTLVFGASAYAVTIVLTTFMFGLGLGSWLAGNRADGCDRQKLVRFYVAIETGIAVYALLLSLLLTQAQQIYIHFYQIVLPSPLLFNTFKIVLSFLLLAPPTLLIGATLPVMARFLIRERQSMALSISQLYAANTFGAILGTLATGYFLLPRLGISLTNSVAVCINLFVAGAFWMIAKSMQVNRTDAVPVEVQADRIVPPASRIQATVIAAFCLSGAAAMFYEVVWTRTLTMILGTTTYAFSTMLAAFLVGIALGSALYRLLPDRLSRIKLFVLLQVLIGVSALLTLPLFEKLPFVYLSLQRHWVQGWQDMQVLRFFLALLVMIIPTTAMGMLFPVVNDLVIEKTAHLGRQLGKVVALNTFGSAAGAAATGLLLIPLIGLEKSILAGVALNLTAALAAHFTAAIGPLRQRIILPVAICTAFLLLSLSISPWAPGIINSGAYVYADRYENMLQRYRLAAKENNILPDLSAWQLWEMAMNQYDLLYYRPGVSATVAVMQRQDGVRFLTIDGKTDASTGTKSDMRTQIMIGQLPMLFHPQAEDVLVVGLGSGVTVGSVLTHPVRNVDCAEISPGVIEAAQFFSDANHHALENPRLSILPRDARNLLLTSSKAYDVIISQPSNPWISGESSLFSLDWYRMVNAHLKDQGLFLQWVPSYLMTEKDLKIILHTLRAVFPDLTVWNSGSVGDLVLLAKKGDPLTVDYRLFKRKLTRDAVWSDIARIGLDPLLLPLRLFVMNAEQVGIYLYADLNRPLPRNTDDLLFTAFSTPKQIVSRQRVKRFIDPRNLRADADTVMQMLVHVNEKELLHLLQSRRDMESGDSSPPPDSLTENQPPEKLQTVEAKEARMQAKT